jgi:hypothetical protein
MTQASLTLEEARKSLPLPHTHLIEHLEEVFGRVPTGRVGKQGGLDGAIDIAQAHAKAEGQVELLSYLKLLNAPE